MTFPHQTGDRVAVTVVGTVRRVAAEAVTVDVGDPQEPVIRVPLASVTSVTDATADTAAATAYDESAGRPAVEWRARRVGFPPEIVFGTEVAADPGFDIEAAPGSDLIAVGRYDLTPSKAAALAAALLDAVAVARSSDDEAAAVALRARGAEVAP